MSRHLPLLLAALLSKNDRAHRASASVVTRISSGWVFMVNTRAQRNLLHTCIILAIVRQHLVQIDRIDRPTGYLSKTPIAIRSACWPPACVVKSGTLSALEMWISQTSQAESKGGAAHLTGEVIVQLQGVRGALFFMSEAPLYGPHRAATSVATRMGFSPRVNWERECWRSFCGMSPCSSAARNLRYRDTSLIRNSLPPSDHHRTLGIVLL